METYRYYSYDVWGNAEDGFEVNDVYRSALTVVLPADISDSDVSEELVKQGLFTGPSTEIDVEWDGYDTAIIYDNAEAGCPIGELRREGGVT